MKNRSLVVFVCAALAAMAPAADLKTLVFEAEMVSGPASAWQRNKMSKDRWNLWSTDADAAKKWSGGVVLQTPPVMTDRASPDEGVPPLHTHIAGIPNGQMVVFEESAHCAHLEETALYTATVEEFLAV